MSAGLIKSRPLVASKGSYRPTMTQPHRGLFQVMAFLLSLFFAFSNAQVSTVNGQAEYMGTKVEQSPHGIPTMVYNCGKVPALCKTVDQSYPLKPVSFQSVNGLGELQGKSYINLHFDRASNNAKRRGEICKSNWKKKNGCPKTDQPNTVPVGATLDDGSFAPARFNPNNLIIGQAGYNLIANPLGQFSGMMWTCDEFPPASAVEGGSNAKSYCAPMSATCASSMKNSPIPAGSAFVKSEQDFQGNAFSSLRAHVYPGSTTGVYRYHFRTYYNTLSTRKQEPSLEVIWYEPKTKLATNEDETPVYRVVEGHYSNGTISRTLEYLDEDEYELHQAAWDAYETRNFSSIAEELKNPILWMTHKERQAMGQSKRENQGALKDNFIWDRATGNGTNPAGQRFESLPEPPPLPILEISRDFVEELYEHESVKEPYIERVVEASNAHENSTFLQASSTDLTSWNADHGWMLRRQSNRQCDSTEPCPDGSCCNKMGRCGYTEETCGDDVCVSNCDAKALCGRDSESGKVSCPLNVCCSYYGYCGVENDFCNGAGPTAPCQEGFGSCSTISPPSCGGNSAFARSIGYYQFANVRERQCNRISPDQIKTDGLTHLYGAFATINPETLTVEPWDSSDVELYKELTALKKNGHLETWIAIGGWNFNDPGPTRTTFSDIASNASRRSRFIKSLLTFLEIHDFQGVDLDWEYPGAPDRGGVKQDTDNYVSLLKEMREAFGTKYGISVAIPASYWYLRWFKPKEMEPYVDWFGVMAYDLHGPWDEDVKQIGKVILGHTNVPEIANWSLPLYYDNIEPSKLNMGLAYYARGYTVADSNCNGVGCNWSGPSRPASCTNFGGVVSLQEIERMIKEENMTPKLLASDKMMELTYGDQWIGYDNEETIQMKKKWASSRCFGGTMIWSVDQYSGSGSGDIPDGGGSDDPSDPGGGQGDGSGVVYIDPEIWEKDSPEINCYPPCTFILPPTSLDTPITMSLPPYETSLDVAWSGTNGWKSTIQTTTLTIPVFTVTTIDAWHITVYETRTLPSSAWSTFDITPSIRPPEFTVTNNLPNTTSDGVTRPPTTRTITPPPYPWTYTPPDPSPTKTKDDDDDDELPPFPIVTWRPGKPGPKCKSKCGKPCRIFCSFPCLTDCIDPGNDFKDPENPDPPTRPVPEPTGYPPTQTNKTPLTTHTPGTAPEDPESEEDEQQCAIEAGLALPTWRPSDSSTSIIPAPTPPAPFPSPDPDPPKPNPNTEKVSCYNSGASIARALAIEAIDYFCDRFEGQTLDANKPETERTVKCKHGVHCIPRGLGCFNDVLMSVTVKNGCRFTIGGKGTNDECGRQLRRMIDECDTSSTQFKQGGKMSSNCADWRIDPNNRWSPSDEDDACHF